ncbi:ATP-binding cassette sub-family D member 3 [Aphelenchoides fujianensis]|nr:ATP-binding cassette sub-family D member 3 [Aphelenchoides fujianensis]
MPTAFSKLTQWAPSLTEAAPALVGTSAVLIICHLYRQKHSLRRIPRAVTTYLSKEKTTKKDEKSHVDFRFLLKLWRIVKILIPRLVSWEVFYMVVIACTLFARTYADLFMITISTQIEGAIIDRDKHAFFKLMLHYMMCMPVISVVNNLLKFGLSELKLRFRERLTHRLYGHYLNGFTFYKMSNLDNRIANADQLLTQDVDRFCEGIVELYSNLSKPLVDVALYVSRIGGALGFAAPGKLFGYLLLSGFFLTYLRRPIGRLTVVEQQLEGEFRFVNSRLIMNSEEIAFYQGNEREKVSVMSAFERMVNHLRSLILFRFSIGFVDNIIAKYCATVVGWYTMSRPFFSRTNSSLRNKSKNEIMQQYYTSGRMMFKLAEALGRLALAGRELTRLSGFTTRVDTLINVLQDLEGGKYQRTMVASNALEAIEDQSTALLTAARLGLTPGAGEIVIADNVIRFDAVPLVTPNGDVLVESLDFEVPSGRNVLVCGPNGCGKSSLFRVLGELWPLWGGRLVKPQCGKLFYVPQRPYMTLGTLRDQVIYPDKPADMRRKGLRDQDLNGFLDEVQLSYILSREGGWDAVSDWMDVLSGGEKQRIAMARLFYHRPQFAILDECTSAVSVDVEGAMYKRCRELNITLFTVSHRKSLWKHHEYFLQMDGRGAYEFAEITDNVEQFGS